MRFGHSTHTNAAYGATSPDQFYGVGVEVSFSVRELYDRAFEESQVDYPSWSMSEDATVRLPPVGFLAHRLRDFVLPTLARVTSLQSLCDALDTRPLSASPFFKGWTGYGIPLPFEMCGHPSLPAVVAETEAFWQAQPLVAWGTLEMRVFLARVPERNTRR